LKTLRVLKDIFGAEFESIAKGAKSTIREISGHIENKFSDGAMTEDEKKQLE
jgi:hypothetical protein